MSGDQVQIVLVAAAWSGSVGVLGLATAWLLRSAPLRVLTVVVAAVAVLSLVAGVVGTARAMFFSEHDYAVVLLVSGVAGAFSLVVALAVATLLGRSSRRLTEDAGRIADPERPLEALELRVPTELRVLAEELRRTDTRLRESRARERALEESRRELVSWVSHDLRTPLAGMRAMAEALEDGLAEDAALYHRRIRDEVDRMVLLVDDLSELSRIHAGVLRLQPVVLDAADLVSDAIATAEPFARSRHVRVDGAVRGPLSVEADARAAERVLDNLMNNAVRHTSPGATVSLVAETRDGAATFEVVDACGGIDPEHLPRVFDVAWQADPARGAGPTESGARGAGGGLGLAIVKGLVEAHGGRVTASNVEGGCRFVVTLPLAPSG